MMNGKELYEHWASANKGHGLEVDEFDTMPEWEQQLWVTMARELEEVMSEAVFDALNPGD